MNSTYISLSQTHLLSPPALINLFFFPYILIPPPGWKHQLGLNWPARLNKWKRLSARLLRAERRAESGSSTRQKQIINRRLVELRGSRFNARGQMKVTQTNGYGSWYLLRLFTTSPFRGLVRVRGARRAPENINVGSGVLREQTSES